VDNVYDIQDHMARLCKCGSAHFNLLKSGRMECAGCHEIWGYWVPEGVPFTVHHHEYLEQVKP